MRRDRNAGRRRGFATTIVIGLMFLVAATVAVVAAVFAAEARRTLAAGNGAQLRQLLMAVPAVAREEIAARGVGARVVEVATPVEGATLALTFVPGGNGKVRVEARAAWKTARAGERVTFVPGVGGKGWAMQEARLTQSP